MGAGLFHVDRRSDVVNGQIHMAKLIVAFRTFVNALKKVLR